MQNAYKPPISLTAERTLGALEVMITSFLSIFADISSLDNALEVAFDIYADMRDMSRMEVERTLLEALNMANIVYDGRWSHAPEHLMALATAFGWSLESAEENLHSRDRIGTTSLDGIPAGPTGNPDEVEDVLDDADDDASYDLSHYDGWDYTEDLS